MSVPSNPDSQLIAEYQNALLFTAERFFGSDPIPKPIRRAYLDTPRHLFAPRFYSSQKRKWIDLALEPLRDHLAELYSDHPLCIHRDQNGRSLSTVSQPSLVLYMLDLLDLKPGLSVFELGGGSGWNAALMGRLVGSSGKIASIEIIDSLVPQAQATLAALGLDQVTFQAGDASLGSSENEQFDRGIFTASAWELPTRFFSQIKTGGLLLFVVKAQANYDLLCLLKKTDPNSFVSEFNFTCSFVPVTGQKKLPEVQPISISSLTTASLANELSWADAKIPETAIIEFLEFAKLVFDCQQTFLLETQGADFDEEFWGMQNSDQSSLLIFNEDRIHLYGTEDCLIAFRRAAKRWQKAGQPAVDDLKLSIHSQSSIPEPNNDQWLVKRGESFLLWGV